MAIDLGLPGSPSVHVWAEIEKEMTKKLSNIVHESTGQSRQRLDHIELLLHELRESTSESRQRLEHIECESRQRLEHIEFLLLNSQQHVGLQTAMPNGRHMSEDMGKKCTHNGAAPEVPLRQEFIFEELAVVAPPAARDTRISNLEQGVRQERAVQTVSPYTNTVQANIVPRFHSNFYGLQAGEDSRFDTPKYNII